MPVKADYRGLEKLIRQRSGRAIGATMALAADLLQEALSDPFPPASEEGEYPALRTGQGRENVRGEVLPTGLTGGFGYVHDKSDKPTRDPHKVPGAAHLTELAIYDGRKGPLELFLENLEELRGEFRSKSK